MFKPIHRKMNYDNVHTPYHVQHLYCILRECIVNTFQKQKKMFIL